MPSNPTEAPLPDTSTPQVADSLGVKWYKGFKLEAIKAFTKKYKKPLIVGLFAISLVLSFVPRIAIALINRIDTTDENKIAETTFGKLLYSLSSLSSPSPSPVVSLPASTDSSVLPSPSASPTMPVAPGSPSPTPAAILVNPPIMNVSYPAEGQSITMDNTQTLCVADSPDGGNTQGLLRKSNINSQGWTSYASVSTLCFDPQEGGNTFSLQYKNSANIESQVYTRNFSFHRVSDINITISGQIYNDTNCNGSRDSGESSLDVVTIVRIYEMPGTYLRDTFNSNANGTFSYSTSVSGNSSINLQPAVQSPYAYKSNPHWSLPTFTFNSSNTSASVDYPQVPASSVGQCF